MIFVIAALAFLSAFLGGVLAIRFKDKLHLVLGFSAGAIVGVAIFDLIPEAFELTEKFTDAGFAPMFISVGFVSYMIFDRAFHGHSIPEVSMTRGSVGAGSISFHSFLDGIAIGVAFTASPELGLVLGSAVLMHNFSDGLNTAGLVLRHGGNIKKALKWVTLDAIAPVSGILITMFFKIPEAYIGILLSLFAGSFLYIGASDLLPESHHAHPTKWTTISTLAGIFLIYLAVRIASH